MAALFQSGSRTLSWKPAPRRPSARDTASSPMSKVVMGGSPRQGLERAASMRCWSLVRNLASARNLVRQAADPPGRPAPSVSIRELVALCAPGRIALSLDGVVPIAAISDRRLTCVYGRPDIAPATKMAHDRALLR